MPTTPDRGPFAKWNVLHARTVGDEFETTNLLGFDEIVRFNFQQRAWTIGLSFSMDFGGLGTCAKTRRRFLPIRAGAIPAWRLSTQDLDFEEMPPGVKPTGELPQWEGSELSLNFPLSNLSEQVRVKCFSTPYRKSSILPLHPRMSGKSHIRGVFTAAAGGKGS